MSTEKPTEPGSISHEEKSSKDEVAPTQNDTNKHSEESKVGSPAQSDSNGSASQKTAVSAGDGDGEEKVTSDHASASEKVTSTGQDDSPVSKQTDSAGASDENKSADGDTKDSADADESKVDTDESQQSLPAVIDRDANKPLENATDATVTSTDIVIVGGDVPETIEPWGSQGTGFRTIHVNEDLAPQHEACLCEAAYTDNVELAQEMIDLKVNVNCKRQNGRTPLHYCALGNGCRVARVR